MFCRDKLLQCYTGEDPGFQVRWAHLKKLRRAEGGAKIVGVFRVKNSRFCAKMFSFFPILGGWGRRVRPPGSAPGIVVKHIQQHIYTTSLHVSREVVPIDRDKAYRSAEGWGDGEPFNTHFWV